MRIDPRRLIMQVRPLESLEILFPTSENSAEKLAVKWCGAGKTRSRITLLALLCWKMLYESCEKCSCVLGRPPVSRSAILDEKRPKPSKPPWRRLFLSRAAAREFSQGSRVHGWVRLDLLWRGFVTKLGWPVVFSRKSRKTRRPP